MSSLLFADDIVLISENETNLQKMLDIVYKWCQKWRLSINKDKTKIVHFRKPRQRKSNFNFRFGAINLEIIDKYKYLGTVLDEHLNYNVTADVLAGAGGRALGAIISKFKQFRNIGYSTFTKLFFTSVSPIIEYASEVWGNKEYVKCESSTTGN